MVQKIMFVPVHACRCVDKASVAECEVIIESDWWVRE